MVAYNMYYEQITTWERLVCFYFGFYVSKRTTNDVCVVSTSGIRNEPAGDHYYVVCSSKPILKSTESTILDIFERQ